MPGPALPVPRGSAARGGAGHRHPRVNPLGNRGRAPVIRTTGKGRVASGRAFPPFGDGPDRSQAGPGHPFDGLAWKASDGGSRTRYPQINSLLLYPDELHRRGGDEGNRTPDLRVTPRCSSAELHHHPSCLAALAYGVAAPSAPAGQATLAARVRPAVNGGGRIGPFPESGQRKSEAWPSHASDCGGDATPGPDRVPTNRSPRRRPGPRFKLPGDPRPRAPQIEAPACVLCPG
jgi:hypothetical protein